jgi:antitoxin component YwqK of YwqJK toxin-antitoxin module
MRQLFTIFLTISFATAFSQEYEHKEFHQNGKVKVEYSGKKNAPDGIVKMYYPTGELQGELMFKKGKQHGAAKIYYPTGSIQKELTYKNDDNSFKILFLTKSKFNVYENHFNCTIHFIGVCFYAYHQCLQ